MNQRVAHLKKEQDKRDKKNKNKMIRRTINPGTKVFHAFFGYGKFLRYVSKVGDYYGFAIVEFDDFPGESVISPKKLTENEESTCPKSQRTPL